LTTSEKPHSIGLLENDFHILTLKNRASSAATLEAPDATTDPVCTGDFAGGVQRLAS
jgi:hypothetical protein